MKDKRFVIQKHETADGVHWDLMLEQDEVLTTFRLEEPPEQALVHPVRAERIFDHPLRFLWYEGPVQKGTGCVHIVERGSWRPVGCDWRVGEAWQSEAELGDGPLSTPSPIRPRRTRLPPCRFILEGVILSGMFTLIRTSETGWRFAVEGADADPDHLPR